MSVFSVVTGNSPNLSVPETADAFCYAGACRPVDFFQWCLAQNVKFRPQIGQQGLILLTDFLSGGRLPGGGGDDFR